ncbi:MAG: hypothetical protein ACJ72C_13780, partial [Nitrososphaeraceae archaeon]
MILIQSGNSIQRLAKASFSAAKREYKKRAISTPNAPDGLFERIEKESEDTCIYKRLFLDY